MKICRRCGEQKEAGEFPTNPRCHDGLGSWCRLCHKDASAKWRAEHQTEIDAYNERRRAGYAAKREAEHQAAAKALNKRLREQVKRTRALRDRQFAIAGAPRAIKTVGKLEYRRSPGDRE